MKQALPVIVLGAGGHARVCIDALRLAGWRILGICDPALTATADGPLGVPLLGNDDILATHDPAAVLLVNGLGSVRSLAARSDIYARFTATGWRFASVIHPSAIISPHASLEDGCQVMAGAVVQCGARVGPDAIINTRASIDHDCIIGRSVHIAPGCTLSGSVSVGERTHIGTGTTVIQGISIGSDCFIAAGSLIVGSLPDHSRVKPGNTHKPA